MMKSTVIIADLCSQANPWRNIGLILKMFTALINMTTATWEISADFMENTAARFKKNKICLCFFYFKIIIFLKKKKKIFRNR